MSDVSGRLFQSGWSGVTQSDIAAFIGKTLTSGEQTLCTSLISACEDYLARQCRRNFLSTASYFDNFDSGCDKYYFVNYPVKEVTKIVLEGVTKYDKESLTNTYTLGKDFFVYPDHIKFWNQIPLSVSFPQRALFIYYTLDDVVGADIKQAIKQWVSEQFLNREFAGKGLNSINVNGISMSFNGNSIPDYIKSIVDQYKKVLI